MPRRKGQPPDLPEKPTPSCPPHHRFHPGNPSWRNWVGNQSCVPARIVAAANEHDVIEAVREARAPASASEPQHRTLLHGHRLHDGCCSTRAV